jgi:hypothetical protein
MKNGSTKWRIIKIEIEITLKGYNRRCPSRAQRDVEVVACALET